MNFIELIKNQNASHLRIGKVNLSVVTLCDKQSSPKNNPLGLADFKSMSLVQIKYLSCRKYLNEKVTQIFSY